jgi:hypothetical protein
VPNLGNTLMKLVESFIGSLICILGDLRPVCKLNGNSIKGCNSVVYLLAVFLLKKSVDSMR